MRWVHVLGVGCLTLCGCAGRLLLPNGDTYVVGLADVQTSLAETPSGQLMVSHRRVAAPIEIAVVPYGFEATVGRAVIAEEALYSTAPPTLHAQGSWAVALPGTRWSFGLHRSWSPSPGILRARVNTVAGAQLRFGTTGPFVMAGAHQRTVTEASGSCSGSHQVIYQIYRGNPRVKVTQNKTEPPHEKKRTD